MKRSEIDVHTGQTLKTQQVTLLLSHNAALSPSWFPLLSRKTNLRPKHTGEPKSPDGGAGSCGQSHLAVPPALVSPAWPHPAAGKACSCSVPHHFPSRGPTTAAPSLPVQLVRRTWCATHFLLPPRQDVARMHAPCGSQAPCSTVGAVPTPSLQQQGAQLFISPFGGEEKAAGCLGRGAAAWHCSCKITCSPSSACNPQHSELLGWRMASGPMGSLQAPPQGLPTSAN